MKYNKNRIEKLIFKDVNKYIYVYNLIYVSITCRS